MSSRTTLHFIGLLSLAGCRYDDMVAPRSTEPAVAARDSRPTPPTTTAPSLAGAPVAMEAAQGGEPKSDEPASVEPAVDNAPPALSSQDRETVLRGISPNPARWQLVPDSSKIWGYVCAFYSVPPSPDCRQHDVRLVARYRFRGKSADDCEIDATLYFAPMRIPNRPPRDSENTFAFESDGTFFRYTELDDYVVELSGCAPVPQQCHRDSRRWIASLGDVLQLRKAP